MKILSIILYTIFLIPYVCFAGPQNGIDVFTVKKMDIVQKIQAPATVKSATTIAVTGKISGFIESITVDVGSRVSKGDILVKINADEIYARVMQAKTRLSKVQGDLRIEQGLLAKQAATADSVRKLKDSVKIAQQHLNEAKVLYNYRIIKAPISGVITGKFLEQGDLLNPGVKVFNLEDSSKMQVVANIPESILKFIKIGNTLPIYIESSKKNIVGRIVEIAPTNNKISRTVGIKLDIKNNDNVRTGQYAKIFLPGDVSERLMIPKESVIFNGQMEQVFIIKDNKKYLRLIRVGESLDGMVEVLSGLNIGDNIVVGYLFSEKKTRL